jgi:hypothetical protein
MSGGGGVSFCDWIAEVRLRVKSRHQRDLDVVALQQLPKINMEL